MSNLLIVGIGASAGGIHALKDFFEHVPPDSGMAYVVILHLSPSHDSQLAQVLQVATSMPVLQLKETVHIEPNHVYVIPPDKHLSMEAGMIAVSQNISTAERRAPVDIFFRSLAESHGARAVAVVLSGTGANGSMGMKRVKEMGGAAFVQSPREAEFSEMPRNSIATDLVDAVLPAADIPAQIMAYKGSLGTVRIAVNTEDRAEEDELALRSIFTRLRSQTGNDFSNYKRPTLLRRIERRINVRALPDLAAYATYMEAHPEETHALLKDLLISVTNFFRDRAAFEALETDIIPRILQDKKPEDEVRIWVAGCATGEEAYSIAMLLAEQSQNAPEAPKIQIFATDIDEAAIATARDGFYTLNDAADVSPERLRSFFNKEDEGYRIRREIREMILFAQHNFIKDPPFSRLDLITCRNVLIYLNRTAQERVMETFHFSLQAAGYLMLGTSESIDGAGDLYHVASREQHIYQSRKLSVRTYSLPDAAPSYHHAHAQNAPLKQEGQPRLTERAGFGDLHQRLLEQYAPPSIIVNEEYDIVHISERAGKYLRISGGELSQNVIRLIREELQLELRGALYQSTQRQTAVDARGLKLYLDGNTETINILVRPVLREGDAESGFILIVFEPAADADSREAPMVLTSDEPVMRQMEEEVVRMKAQLRGSREQHEFQEEELKASNEELQAMNEELRSSAEELETSKEELHSMNEELSTVNQELKVKVEEATLTSNNLQNIINSTDIATIFLDRSFRVVLFTPATRIIFNLIPADYGRPLSDITNRLTYGNLIADAETVLETLHMISREVRTTDGLVFLMRLLPYRTDEDRIQGVVLTFVDITERKKAEIAKYLLASIVESSEDSVVTVDFNGFVTSWNGAAEKLYGVEAQSATGRLLSGLPLPEDLKIVLGNIEHVKQNRTAARLEAIGMSKDGQLVQLEIMLSPVKDEAGEVIGVATIARDVTERKEIEEALRRSEENLRITMASIRDYAILTMDTDRRITGWNTGAESIFGYTEAEIIGQLFDVIFTPEDNALGAAGQEVKTALAQGHASDERWHLRKDGSRFYASGVMNLVQNGELQGLVKVARDLTERRQAEQLREVFIGVASHELRTPVTSIKAYVELLRDTLIQSGQEADAESISLVKKLGGQVERLATLVKDLLDVTKFTDSTIHLTGTHFSITDLITETVDELQHTTTHRLRTDLSPVPEVYADRERIRQVLVNLLSNAIKYSPEAGRINVTASMDAHSVIVRVMDYGIGMGAEAKEQIFERFYRSGDARIQTYPGLGLGLYIASEIIRKHGGKIWATSEPGMGSIFSFSLPLERRDAADFL